MCFGRLWAGFSGGGDGEGHLNYGMVVFSDDDGETWASRRRLPPGLTGDRHSPCYVPDGRLVVLMRDTLFNGSSPTEEHFIAWIGRYRTTPLPMLSAAPK